MNAVHCSDPPLFKARKVGGRGGVEQILNTSPVVRESEKLKKGVEVWCRGRSF